MNSSTLRRKIIVLLLGTSLAASATAASDLRSSAIPRPLPLLTQGTTGLLERLASLLGLLWEKTGASLDPYGLPGNSQSNGAGKNGATIDPYGVPSNGQSTGEEGGSPDPNGGR